MEGEITFEDGTYFSSPLLYFCRVVLSMNPSTHPLASRFAVNADTQVHTEFSTMFQLKITVFFTELLSVLLTPWILFFSLPPCSATIIDFFREFTVHVDGIGYVCSFAVFDFQLHNNIGKDAVDATASGNVPAGNTGARKRQKAQNNASGQKDYKMEKSFLHFKATHPDWQPDLNGSIFLDKVSRRTSTLAPNTKVEERSHSYDRARSTGSHSQYHRGRTRREMATMLEDEEEEENGWDNRPDSGSEEEGFMRDAGMVGLLQQVMKR